MSRAVPVDLVDLGPGVLAGFTTRAGGTSRPPYDSLDLALHVGDDPLDVAANRHRVEAWASAPVAFATQVHGARVRRVGGPPAPGTTSVGEADAMVTATGSVALAVLVADCVPVLLADPVARVVGVAHAGRAGLVAGVLAAVLDELVAAGAAADRLRAVVGPCIAGASYEVPAALRDQVAAVVPATAATTAWGTPALDLAAGAAAVLERLGVREVTVVARDTFTTADLFSHRRDGPRTGRFAGLVRLLPARGEPVPVRSGDTRACRGGRDARGC